MEWLVVGLGNPGEKYRSTRHNVGFMVVDEIAARMKVPWHDSQKFKAKIAEAEGFCLVKPQTFMNLSGVSVSKLVQFYKLPTDRMIVIHDDLDMQFGAVKSGLGKGPKQHNGLLSIEQKLGTDTFWRIRVGVDDRSPEERKTLSGQAYVLQPLTQVDKQTVSEAITSAVQSFDTIARYARISDSH